MPSNEARFTPSQSKNIISATRIRQEFGVVGFEYCRSMWIDIELIVYMIYTTIYKILELENIWNKWNNVINKLKYFYK